jgi:predicted phosphoadenosine phosphosulfate sulfurtransferase
MMYRIKEEDGKFVVEVQKVVSIEKPFWKFWGPTSKESWVTATKKDGKKCVYDKRHHAAAFVQFTGGTLSK